VIGTWNLTGFTLANSSGTSNTLTATAFTAAQETSYSYGVAGVALSMGPGSGGIQSFGYSISATIDPTYAGLYAIDGVTILGRDPITGYYTGPNSGGSNIVYPAGDVTFSNFSGTATLSDPNNNLVAADGLTFTTATDIGGYNRGDSGYDWTPANLKWSLSTNAGDTMTYAVNYGSTRQSATEGSAFTFNVVQETPEPAPWALLLAPLAFLAAWRARRTARAAV